MLVTKDIVLVDPTTLGESSACVVVVCNENSLEKDVGVELGTAEDVKEVSGTGFVVVVDDKPEESTGLMVDVGPIVNSKLAAADVGCSFVKDIVVDSTIPRDRLDVKETGMMVTDSTGVDAAASTALSSFRGML